MTQNSCRNRHCTKCQATAARRWLEAGQTDLLPGEYYHFIFMLPAPIADIAYPSKTLIYGLLSPCAIVLPSYVVRAANLAQLLGTLHRPAEIDLGLRAVAEGFQLCFLGGRRHIALVLHAVVDLSQLTVT